MADELPSDIQHIMGLLRQFQIDHDDSSPSTGDASEADAVPAENFTLSVETAKAWLQTGALSSADFEARYSLSELGVRGHLFADFSTYRQRLPLMFECDVRRDMYIREIGFAIPCAEAVSLIASYGPILEIGAGTGFWSALIAREGVEVMATDLFGGDQNTGWHGRYFPVEQLDAEQAVIRHPGRTVLLCWPETTCWGGDAVAMMKVGSILCHIGERGGCTGDARLDEIMSRDFEVLHRVYIPQWPNINDYMLILKRVAVGPVEDRRRRKRRHRKAGIRNHA